MHYIQPIVKTLQTLPNATILEPTSEQFQLIFAFKHEYTIYLWYVMVCTGVSRKRQLLQSAFDVLVFLQHFPTMCSTFDRVTIYVLHFNFSRFPLLAAYDVQKLLSFAFGY